MVSRIVRVDTMYDDNPLFPSIWGTLCTAVFFLRHAIILDICCCYAQPQETQNEPWGLHLHATGPAAQRSAKRAIDLPMSHSGISTIPNLEFLIPLHSFYWFFIDPDKQRTSKSSWNRSKIDVCWILWAFLGCHSGLYGRCAASQRRIVQGPLSHGLPGSCVWVMGRQWRRKIRWS